MSSLWQSRPSILVILLLLTAILAMGMARASMSRPTLVQRIFGLLDEMDKSEDLNKDTKFAALLGEFLIKQKSRFQEPNRYEEQIFYHIRHKLSSIIRKTEEADLTEDVKRVLDSIFQGSALLLLEPNLQKGHIDTSLDYKDLALTYDIDMQFLGYPNMSQSDDCLASFATLRKCSELRGDCLSVVVSHAPTLGYERMHQILLLYVFMHHKCSQAIGTEAAYRRLADHHCSQVWREQAALRWRGIPQRYRDLYLEQAVICGLFGYQEFLNWPHLELLGAWPHAAPGSCCLCMWPGGMPKPNDGSTKAMPGAALCGRTEVVVSEGVPPDLVAPRAHPNSCRRQIWLAGWHYCESAHTKQPAWKCSGCQM